jgi:hypothetical protein
MKSTEEQNRRQNTTADAKGGVKKPYVKPEVRHERVFETMALSCGKVNSTEGMCHFNRKTS